MMPTPRQPYKRDGLGAVNDHTGETVGLCRRRNRRQEVAERLQALVDKQPTGPISVACDPADPQAEQAVAAVVRAATGRLVRRDRPTSRPWLNPIERRWRQVRRDVTHGERCASLAALRKAAHACVDRDHPSTERV
jgi:hypothetical protein